MKLVSRLQNNTILYRIRKRRWAALSSFVLALSFALLLCYLMGQIYPEVKLFSKVLSYIGFKHNEQYIFYSGAPGGAYYAIGQAVQGTFDDGDSVTNQTTTGGSENARRIPVTGDAFGLAQQEMI